MRIQTSSKCLGFLVVLTYVLVPAITLAAKPDKPGGGKGGGGEDPPRYQVIELIGYSSGAYDLSEASATAEVVWVAGIGDEAGYAAAMYSTVSPSGDLTTAYLPEPQTPLNGGPGSDVYGDTFNRASFARAVNNHGDIAGACDFYDPGATQQEYSQPRATLWVNTAEGYELIDLGLADASHEFSEAYDVNDSGLVVGRSGGYLESGSFNRAVVWIPGAPALDLNDLLPQGSPWLLERARSVNELGQVCGQGWLDGIRRGFIVDLNDNSIVAVPLLPGGDQNVAYDINESGAVTGWATTIDGSGNVVRRTYLWTGVGAPAIDLGSVTGEVSIGHGINDLDEVVGESQLIDDPIFSQSATYWNPATEEMLLLDSEIPSKPKWLLRWGAAINNQGWIVANGAKNVRGSTWYETGALLIPN